MTQGRDAKSLHFSSLALAIACLSLTGCYWSSRSVSQAGFETNMDQAGGPRQLPIRVAVVGVDQPGENLAAAVNRLAEKTRACPPERRALLAADCGIAALHAGDVPTAREMLDEAVMIASGVSVGGDRERAATQLDRSEAAKVFKGEPHERVMMYFYRGLLYVAEGDPENAHACFLNAALQDAQARDDNTRGNWLAVDLLTLLCKRRIGDPSADDFGLWLQLRYSNELAEAGELLGHFNEPVIFVFGVGRGPAKETVHDRRGRVSLAYREYSSHVQSVLLSASAQTQRLTLADNVYIQAVTRGRRSMDEILTKKSRAQQGTEAVGTGLLTAGQIGANFVPGADLLGMLIFEASMEKADRIDTSADVRALHTLPGHIYIGIAERGSLPEVVKIEVLGENEEILAWATAKLSSYRSGSIVVVGLLPY